MKLKNLIVAFLFSLGFTHCVYSMQSNVDPVISKKLDACIVKAGKMAGAAQKLTEKIDKLLAKPAVSQQDVEGILEDAVATYPSWAEVLDKVQ